MSIKKEQFVRQWWGLVVQEKNQIYGLSVENLNKLVGYRPDALSRVMLPAKYITGWKDKICTEWVWGALEIGLIVNTLCWRGLSIKTDL